MPLYIEQVIKYKSGALVTQCSCWQNATLPPHSLRVFAFCLRCSLSVTRSVDGVQLCSAHIDDAKPITIIAITKYTISIINIPINTRIMVIIVFIPTNNHQHHDHHPCNNKTRQACSLYISDESTVCTTAVDPTLQSAQTKLTCQERAKAFWVCSSNATQQYLKLMCQEVDRSRQLTCETAITQPLPILETLKVCFPCCYGLCND